MVLIIEGSEVDIKTLGDSVATVTAGLVSLPFIQQQARQLQRSSKEISRERIFYVGQREWAAMDATQADYLGSGAATTCVIVILRANSVSANGKACCAHFDGADEEQLAGPFFFVYLHSLPSSLENMILSVYLCTDS